METSIINQAYIFAASICGGIVISLIFDIFRAIRQASKTSNLLTHVQDVLFWIIATITIFTLISIINNGELRWYEFLGITLGAIIYYLIFSNYIIKTLGLIFNILKKTYIVIKNILLFPITIVYNIIRRPVKLLMKILISIYKYIKKHIKKLNNKLRFSIHAIKKQLERT